MAYSFQTNAQSIDNMSLTPYTMAPTSNFQLITDALYNYTKQTGIDLANHPSADRFDLLDSPDAFLRVIQERETAFRKHREKNRTLIRCLSPAVQILHAFSCIIGEAVSPVSHTCLVLLSCSVMTQCDLASISHQEKLYLLESMFCSMYVQP